MGLELLVDFPLDIIADLAFLEKAQRRRVLGAILFLGSKFIGNTSRVIEL